MASWNYYVVTEPKEVRLEDAERALQAACSDFDVDSDLIVLRNGYAGGDLECGQISIQKVTSPTLLPDRAWFEEQAHGKQNQEHLMDVLDSAKSLVSIQLLNDRFWWNNEPERTLRPLQDWLLESFDGVLWVEGGEFYDRRGPVL